MPCVLHEEILYPPPHPYFLTLRVTCYKLRVESKTPAPGVTRERASASLSAQYLRADQ